MSAQAEKRRSTAEVVETDDGFEVLPPTVREKGDVPADLLDAIEAALADAPNTVADPAVASVENATDYPERRDHHVGYLYARYQELPATDEDGELLGWKAPYRAREEFDAALREHLPDQYAFEARDSSTTTFYREDRR